MATTGCSDSRRAVKRALEVLEPKGQTMVPPPSAALRLGRALIAIAWSDGRLDADERRGLSDILFRLPELHPEEWEELRQELEAAPSDDAATATLEDLRSSLEQRDVIVPFLDLLCTEDSPFSTTDRELANEIRTELDAGPGSGMPRWAGHLRERLRAGADRVRQEIENLRRGEAELRGDLPQSLREQLAASGILDRLDEGEFRKLGLLGALLGRVAHADRRLDRAELLQMQDTLEAGSRLSSEEARLVCEIGCQKAHDALDSYALSREFFQLSTEDERIATLDLLFALAHSDGEATPDEIEEIRRVRQGFLLSHRHFADARVRARQRAEARRDQSTP
jgi:uncharacterized tellurite resistance protein B-like protein